MWRSFLSLDARVQAAIISAVVGSGSALLVALWSHVLGRWGLEHRLKAEYEFAQRKALRDAAAEHQGRLVESAESLNLRLWNLLKNHGQGWLRVNGRYGGPSAYYFHSTVQRFLDFVSLARGFEQRALCFDGTVAKSRELVLLKYVKAVQWAVVDVYLFDGLPYDQSESRDHFFRDQLAADCDAYQGQRLASNGEVKDLASMVSEDGVPLRATFLFFDGLGEDEPRYRWERLLVLHLLVLAFLNEFGYDMQHSRRDSFEYVVNRIKHLEVLQNLREWIPKLGLGGAKGTKELRRALTKVPKPEEARGPSAWKQITRPVEGRLPTKVA